jgi:hypothetical protein
VIKPGGREVAWKVKGGLRAIQCAKALGRPGDKVTINPLLRIGRAA